MQARNFQWDVAPLGQSGGQGQGFRVFPEPVPLRSPTPVGAGSVGATLGSLGITAPPRQASGSVMKPINLRTVDLHQVGRLYGLSPREISVITALAVGKTDKGIASTPLGGEAGLSPQPIQNAPPHTPLLEVFERRLGELRDHVRDLETERTTNAAVRNRALLGAMVDQGWLGARLLALLFEPRTVTELALLVGQSIDPVAVSLARLHRGGAVDAEGGHFRRSERGTETVTRLQQATGVDLATP